MVDLSKPITRIKELLGKDFKLKLIVGIGLIGMLLILIAQFKTDNKSSRSEAATSEQNSIGAEYLSEEEYAQNLEARLQELISNVDGVGRVEVMVTLEHGTEYIYALEEKSKLDKSTDTNGGEGTVIDYKHDVEYSYVFVDIGYGEKQPLLKTKVPPKVQGVVIVCDGADNAKVEQNILNVVTTALHIPTTRVCVVKINAN